MQVTKPVIDQIVNTVQETAKKGLELFEKQVRNSYISESTCALCFLLF